MHKEVARFDNVSVRKAEITPEGYLKADAIVTRAGVFTYINGDGTIRRELRHPKDVFDQVSLDSMKMRPITNGHPSERLVNATNVKNLAIGFTGESINVQDNFVISSLLVTDTNGVRDIKENRKQQLSLGYTVDLIQEDGEFEGEPYDHRQTNIRYNHLAIVDKGRAGPNARIHLDSSDAREVVDTDYTFNFNEEKTMSDEKMTEVVLDGIEYKASLEVASAYKKSMTALSEANIKIDNSIKEVDLLKADRDSLKEKLDAANNIDIDALVKDATKERVKLIESAAKLIDINLDEMSTVEIKTAVVKHNCANVNLDDKSQVYIEARFDALVEDFALKTQTSSMDKQRLKVLPKLDAREVVSIEGSREKMLDRLKNGWKTTATKGAK